MKIDKKTFKKLISEYLSEEFDTRYSVFEAYFGENQTIDLTNYANDYGVEGLTIINVPKIVLNEQWEEDADHDAWEICYSKTELLFEDLGYTVVVNSQMERLRVGGDTEDKKTTFKVFEIQEVSDTDIKKYLLKGKPKARFDYIRKGKAYYSIETKTGSESLPTGKIIFEIPIDDMGDADFNRKMEGNLLLRWIYSYTKIA